MSDDEEYEIESIVDYSYKFDTHWYLVRWKGYSSADDSWLDINSCTDCTDEIRRFHLKHPKVSRAHLKDFNIDMKKKSKKRKKVETVPEPVPVKGKTTIRLVLRPRKEQEIENHPNDSPVVMDNAATNTDNIVKSKINAETQTRIPEQFLISNTLIFQDLRREESFTRTRNQYSISNRLIFRNQINEGNDPIIKAEPKPVEQKINDVVKNHDLMNKPVRKLRKKQVPIIEYDDIVIPRNSHI